jgi:hypothetical protein
MGFELTNNIKVVGIVLEIFILCYKMSIKGWEFWIFIMSI